MKKLLAAVLALAVGFTLFIPAALADDGLSLDETGQIVAVAIEAAARVYAVWRVPNAVRE